MAAPNIVYTDPTGIVSGDATEMLVSTGMAFYQNHFSYGTIGITTLSNVYKTFAQLDFDIVITPREFPTLQPRRA